MIFLIINYKIFIILFLTILFSNNVKVENGKTNKNYDDRYCNIKEELLEQGIRIHKFNTYEEDIRLYR